MALPTRLLPTRPGISVQLLPLALAKNRSQFHPPRARPFPGPLLRRNAAAVWRRPRTLPSYPSPQARPSAASPAPQAGPEPPHPAALWAHGTPGVGTKRPRCSLRGWAQGAGQEVRRKRCGSEGLASPEPRLSFRFRLHTRLPMGWVSADGRRGRNAEAEAGPREPGPEPGHT